MSHTIRSRRGVAPAKGKKPKPEARSLKLEAKAAAPRLKKGAKTAKDNPVARAAKHVQNDRQATKEPIEWIQQREAIKRVHMGVAEAALRLHLAAAKHKEAKDAMSAAEGRMQRLCESIAIGERELPLFDDEVLLEFDGAAAEGDRERMLDADQQATADAGAENNADPQRAVFDTPLYRLLRAKFDLPAEQLDALSAEDRGQLEAYAQLLEAATIDAKVLLNVTIPPVLAALHRAGPSPAADAEPPQVQACSGCGATLVARVEGSEPAWLEEGLHVATDEACAAVNLDDAVPDGHRYPKRGSRKGKKANGSTDGVNAGD